MKRKTPEQSLTDAILKAIEEQKPETITQLLGEIRTRFPLVSEKEIINIILRLENESKFELKKEQTSERQMTIKRLIWHATWYWTTVFLALITIISVYMIPEDDYPLVIVRYFLGAVFILWLPGYAFIKALFPQHLPFTRALKRSIAASRQNLDIIERVVLSLATSLALIPIVGFLLNYTPWGIQLTPIVLSLAALTLVFANVAIAREYQMAKNSSRNDRVFSPDF